MSWPLLKRLFGPSPEELHAMRCGVPTVRVIRDTPGEEVTEDQFRPVRDRRDVGRVSDSLVGTGASITLDIDSGSDTRSWLWLSVYQYVTASSIPETLAYPVWLYGADTAVSSKPIVGYAPPVAGGPFPVWNARVPGRYARAVLLGAPAVTRTFELVGYWQEDR